MDRDDRVREIVGAGEERRDLGFGDLRADRRQFGFQFRPQRITAFLGSQLDQGVQVADALRDEVELPERTLERGLLLERRVCLVLVVPEIGCFEQAGKFLQARFLGRSVKDAPGAFRS